MVLTVFIKDFLLFFFLIIIFAVFFFFFAWGRAHLKSTWKYTLKYWFKTGRHKKLTIGIFPIHLEILPLCQNMIVKPTYYVGSHPIQINQLEIDTKDKILEALSTSLSLENQLYFSPFQLYKTNSIFLLFNSNVKLQTTNWDV